MTDPIFCLVCGELIRQPKHRCPPAWIVELQPTDNKGLVGYYEPRQYQIRARSEIAAAEAWAAHFDKVSLTSTISQYGQAAIVHIWPAEGKRIEAKVYTVTGRMVPTYSAKEGSAFMFTSDNW